MRSRAHFRSHPIHPALIPFPFAFLTAVLPFDLLGILLDNAQLWTTGGYLTMAGLAAAVLAAVPGVIDYLYTVPPESSGKKRAMQHAGSNVLALGLFAGAFAARAGDWSPGAMTLLLELLGTGALGYAGWLGGALVTRNLISVDHRYAHAGKWQEARFTSTGTKPLVVGHVGDLQENQMKLLHVNNRRIVLARTADGYQAFDDRCTHRGGSLAGGVLICGTVQCLWHGSQFDTLTGEVRCGPAQDPIRTYPLEAKPDGRILLVSPPR